MSQGRPRPRVAVWDERPPPKKKDPRLSTPCPACGKPVVSTKSERRVYCHAGCRQAAQAAELRLEANTLRLSGDGCWLWQGTRNRSGYGTFSIGHRTVFVHRFALERYLGRSLGNELALHACNNPACVRPGPGHLYAGDHERNMRDMAEANHGAGATTTWDERLDMAEALARGEAVDAIAQRYGVTPTTVRRWHGHFFPVGESAPAPALPAAAPDSVIALQVDHETAVALDFDLAE